ncbi:MAG: hypothetical protein ACRDT2_08905 [Natronosporangium sp.]
MAVVLVLGLAGPAFAGPFDPDDPCTADPTTVECRQTETTQPPEDPDEGGGRWCGRHNGVRVPCNDPRLGFWVGTPNVIYGYYTGGPDVSLALVGCWARRPQFPGPRPQPQDSAFPIRGEDTGGPGRWFVLSCLGPDGVWPGGVAEGVAAVWLFTADLDAGADPEGIARRALAQVGLRAPRLVLAPPASGSVPVGMPVWLAVSETDAAWGPISSGPVCEQGLCVEVTATAERVEWHLGDGSLVSCARGQNTAWQPGMNFLAPGEACHHFYPQPGGYEATATVTWLAEWAGGGESGVFTDVADVCGAAGDEPCASTVAITVAEIQVVGTR